MNLFTPQVYEGSIDLKLACRNRRWKCHHQLRGRQQEEQGAKLGVSNVENATS